MSELTDELRRAGDDLSLRAAEQIDWLVAYKTALMRDYPKCRQIVDVVVAKVEARELVLDPAEVVLLSEITAKAAATIKG